MKPIRTCMICKQKFDKDKLFRIVCEDGKLILDTKQTKQMRAIYICKNDDCVNKIRKQRVFNRAFRRDFNEQTYDEIIKSMGKE